MLSIKPSKIYISSANADMRKGIDGFASIAEQQFMLNPMSDVMFVFHNRHCDKIKLLYWDRDGYCLLHKRIERGRFIFPKHIETEKNTISEDELCWLLHGLHIEEIRHYENLKSKKFSTKTAVLNTV